MTATTDPHHPVPRAGETGAAPTAAPAHDRPLRTKRPVPFYWWPLWMAVLALGLFIFYVVFTPVWMGIRLVAWLSERSR